VLLLEREKNRAASEMIIDANSRGAKAENVLPRRSNDDHF
jgi:hypothetical protein